MDLEGDSWKRPKKKEERPAEPPSGPRPYTILITDEAQRGYDKLDANVKSAMDGIMERLKVWPEVSGARTLFGKGYAPGKYRMKTWDWRIEFQVNDRARTITVQRIGHRDTFYDEYH